MRYWIAVLCLAGFISGAQTSSEILTGQSMNSSNSLEQETKSALKKMQAAALKDGIKSSRF
jgi:LAS superfamily LD-carboxypeptidase LdcB